MSNYISKANVNSVEYLVKDSEARNSSTAFAYIGNFSTFYYTLEDSRYVLTFGDEIDVFFDNGKYTFTIDAIKTAASAAGLTTTDSGFKGSNVMCFYFDSSTKKIGFSTSVLYDASKLILFENYWGTVNPNSALIRWNKCRNDSKSETVFAYVGYNSSFDYTYDALNQRFMLTFGNELDVYYGNTKKTFTLSDIKSAAKSADLTTWDYGFTTGNVCCFYFDIPLGGLFVTDKHVIDDDKLVLFESYWASINPRSALVAWALEKHKSKQAAQYAAHSSALNTVYKNSSARFMFFSDVHGQPTNVERIIEKATSLPSGYVDAIINGGDTVGNLMTEGLDWYNSLVDISPVDILHCAGNHDMWTAAFTEGTALQVYNLVTAKVASTVGSLVQPSGAAKDGLNYYYKDYGNVRVIVTAAMVYDDDGRSSYKSIFWTSAQKTWFEAALADAKDNGKAVICVCHAPFKRSYAVRDDSLCWNSYRNMITDTSYKTYDGYVLSDEAVECVDSFISDGGKFVCWLTGHNHEDNIFTATGHPGQIMINIATANHLKHDDGWNSDSFDDPMYDCFDYIGVDTSNGFLKIMRIGWNIDGSMKVRNFLGYDYINKKITAAS